MQTLPNSIKRLLALMRGGLTIVAAVALGLSLWPVVDGVGSAAAAGTPVRPDEALTAAVAAAALACLAWFAMGVVLELLTLAPGAAGRAARAAGDAVTPPLLRRVAGLVLGVGVVSGWAPHAAVASPVAAGLHVSTTATAPLPDPRFAAVPDAGGSPPAPRRATAATRSRDRPAETAVMPTPGSSVPDPGWVPTAPPVRAQPDVRALSTSPRPADPTTAEVVVRRGDSLWSIAARHLGAEASDVEIAAAWPAWYAANRDVIGDDPDLLLPGQVLRAPEVVGP